VDARLALGTPTPVRGRGMAGVLSTPIHYGRYGLHDMDVHLSRFEGRNMGLCPRVVEDLRHAFNGL